MQQIEAYEGHSPVIKAWKILYNATQRDKWGSCLKLWHRKKLMIVLLPDFYSRAQHLWLRDPVIGKIIP